MKRIIYLASILITGALIAFYSCTKENNNNEKQQASTLVGNGHELTPTDIKVNKLITGFRDKVAYHLENPGLKSGETVSADSALWFLEATINYSHCFPNEYYEGFEVDTAYISLSKDANGNIDMDEVAQKYDEMKTEVATLYHSSSYENKGLAVVDLEESSQTATEIVFDAKTVVGSKNGTPIDGVFEYKDTYMKYKHHLYTIYGEKVGFTAGTEGPTEL